MPIKETSVTRKFEYESPDGDSYRITYLENEPDKRKYIEVVLLKPDGSPEGDPVRWDYEMLIDLSDTLRRLNRKPMERVQTDMSFPKIVDYRNEPLNPSQIQEAVKNSMNRFDNSASPIESFNADQIAYHENSTGVSANEDVKSPDTPADLSLQTSDENVPRWKREAMERISNPAKSVDPAKRIKPVSAQDMI